MGSVPGGAWGCATIPYDAADVPGAVSEKAPPANRISVSFLDVVFGEMSGRASRLWRLRSTYGTMPA